MTFNEIHKPPFDIKPDYITFCRQLKNAVCVCYIDIDDEYVEHWHENREGLAEWLGKMGDFDDAYVYLNSMGIDFRKIMVISRDTLPDFFDYDLYPHEPRAIIEAFVSGNLNPQCHSLGRST